MAFKDPFAKAVENKKEEPMTENDDVTVTESGDSIAGVVTTIKLGAGYDAPWIVMHAPDVAAARRLQASAEFKTHLDHTFEVWKHVRSKVDEMGLGAVSKPSGGSASALPRDSRPNPPGVPEIDCEHGRRAYVSKGNWAALFCAAPEGTPDSEKCEPYWKQKSGKFEPNAKR
jgi:hypothetical protein